jgi:hypothetical protein
MNVTQLLQRLSYGPLSNLNMSNNGDGTIIVGKHPAIISHANDALLKLYAKLNLKEEELIIEQMETVTLYNLHSRHALTTADDNPTLDHYIIDSVNRPFTDDLIKVIRVIEDGNIDVPINDDNHPKSCYTPTTHQLQVPDPEHGKPLYVIYQARHAELLGSGDGYLDQVIDLPDVLVPALVSYIAYCVYQGMNGQEHQGIAIGHFKNFTDTLMEVQDQDLVSVSQSHTSNKFHDRGFR